MRRSKKRIKKRVGIVLGTVLVMVLALGGGAYAVYNHYVGLMNYETLDGYTVRDNVDSEVTLLADGDTTDEDLSALEENARENLENSASELPFNENVLNILIVASEESDDDVLEKSNTLVIVSINSETKEIIAVSLLPDIYIQIPDVGSRRLGDANKYGGPALVIATVEQNFDISIDKYIKMGFDAFENIIDEIDGIYVDLNTEEVDYINARTDKDKQLTGFAETYTYKLDGEQALIYSRIKDIDSSFVKTQRQYNVINAVLDKVSSLNVLQMNSALSELLPMITTDISSGEWSSIIVDIVLDGGYSISRLAIPADDTWSEITSNGTTVIQIDFDKNKELITETIYGEQGE